MLINNRLKKVFFYCILLGLIALTLEVTSFFTINHFFLGRGLVYKPQKITESEYSNYLAKRNKRLGWLQSTRKLAEVDGVGARYSPAFPDPILNTPCISIYGDSYTWSNRRTAEEAWGNQLSLLTDCRVANYGVSGYGSDQALLRVLDNDKDTAKIVILNHFVFDIFRNVNQHWGTRNSVYHTKLMLKPRFVIDDNGNLTLIPIADYTLSEMRDLQKRPSKYLQHEYFLPNTHYGSCEFKIPYTWILLKTIFGHTKFRSLFQGEPTHAPYYQEDHSSHALELTIEILKKFHAEIIEQNRIPVVTIIPYLNDFQYYEINGTWCYQPLLSVLKKSGIQVINIGEELLAIHKKGEIEEIYAGEGHFSVHGDKLMAQIVYKYLSEKELL